MKFSAGADISRNIVSGLALPGVNDETASDVIALGAMLIMSSREHEAESIAPAVCQEMREGPILRSGTPAKARVLAIEPTGGSYNDDQEVEIDLEVQPAGEEAYRAQVETYLHPVHFPRYQPGAMVDVRFDPKKRRDVVLVRP